MKLHQHKMMFGLIAALMMTLASAAHAAPIWSNDITGDSSTNPYNIGNTTAANITVSGLTAGDGPTANAGAGRFNFRWNNSNGYFQWTLQPNAGYAIDFTNITGQWQRSGTGPTSYVVRTSLDGYTAVLASGSITGEGSATSFNLNLGSSTLDEVAGPISIRLYASGATNPAGTFSINNFVVDGSVFEAIVPEPASLGLLGLGGLMLARRGRRSA